MRNDAATFQRLMNSVTSGLVGCEVYLDDVVVASDFWETHVKQVRALLGRIREAKLTINLAKTEFGHAEVKFLGHRIGRGQVRPLDDKIQGMLEYSRPRNRKEVMRFLGMAGFYRRFIRNYADLVIPLTDLTRKKVTFQWTPSCEEAFLKLKKTLAYKPVLQAPQFEFQFTLEVDASERGVEAVLSQAGEDGRDHPVAFYSKKLDKHKKNYATIEKEALAILMALQHFEVYVSSTKAPVHIRTDHNPSLSWTA